MAKQKALPVHELFKFSCDDIKLGMTEDKNILFDDNVVIFHTFREVVLLRFILDIYSVIPNVPITSKHCFKKYYTNDLFTSKTINKTFSVILEDVININIKPSNNRKLLEPLYAKMYDVVNNIYNNLAYELPQYTNSINSLDLLDIQFDPELLKAMQDVYVNRGKEDTYKTVERVNKTYEVLDNILRNDPKHQSNLVARGYRSGTINANQVKQVLASRGYVTELDSNIFKYPIASSFTLGMTDIYDQAIESRSGARALYLSTKAVQDSEYFARELQLVTMIVERLVDGDCGQKKYLEWLVRPKDENISKPDLNNLVGKYYLNEETGQEEVITANHKHLEGKVIKLRSALNCQLEDPRCICTKCFGELSYTIPLHSNIGHYCSTAVTEKITQSILSTKHLSSSANTGDIHLDINAQKFFRVKNNNYYFNDQAKNNKITYKIALHQYEAFGFKDLNVNTDTRKLNLSRVSLITEMILQVDNGNGTITDYPIVIMDNKKKGSFTVELLNYVIKYGYFLDNFDNYVINLDKWDFKHPIITMPELEYNFLNLALNVKSLFKTIKVVKNEFVSNITPEALVQKAFDTLNYKLDINLATLEVIVYAFTVKSLRDRDYSLGRNCPDRQLLRLGDVIANRSLGAGYGHEKVIDLILNPRSFFGKNKVSHPMDIMVKPQEVVLNKYLNK
jgi:hypothetical protein